MAKQLKTIYRKKIIDDLKVIDSRLKMSNMLWNDAVKIAFAQSSSFDFENLAYNAPNTAQDLIDKFKFTS